MTLLLILVTWLSLLALVAGLCAAASIGDAQLLDGLGARDGGDGNEPRDRPPADHGLRVRRRGGERGGRGLRRIGGMAA